MKNILTVTKFTFLEVYRSKLMISLVFLSIGLLGVSYVASEFAYGAPAKVALDVGLGIMSISNLIISIFIGANLINKEIEQRTLYMVISKPISRASFLMGKILGLSSVLLINSLVLGTLSILIYLLFKGTYSSLMFWTILFSFLEAFTVLVFAVFFSLITNTTLSVIFTIAVFIVGHAINETSKLLLVKVSSFYSSLIDISFILVPNFYKLNLKDFVLYQQNISNDYLLSTLLYLAFYLLALLSAVLLIFKNKNLD